MSSQRSLGDNYRKGLLTASSRYVNPDIYQSGKLKKKHLIRKKVIALELEPTRLVLSPNGGQMGIFTDSSRPRSAMSEQSIYMTMRGISS